MNALSNQQRLATVELGSVVEWIDGQSVTHRGTVTHAVGDARLGNAGAAIDGCPCGAAHKVSRYQPVTVIVVPTCEWCGDGSCAEQGPVTDGFHADCRERFDSYDARERAERTWMDAKFGPGSYDAYLADMAQAAEEEEAIAQGRATALMRCYLCHLEATGQPDLDSNQRTSPSPLRGVMREHTVNPADPTAAFTLTCGHTLI
jgi:hypothetical protein